MSIRRWARYFKPDAREDVAEEIGFHLAAKREELIARGVPPERADAEARRQFGDLGRYRAICIEIEEGRIRRMTWQENLQSTMQDLRHALRRLGRAPLFTAAALATLALGLGANAAIFTVVRGVLLKPLAYPEPERLVSVWQAAPGLGIPELNAGPATYFTYREESRAFERTGIWQPGSAAITGIAEPERVPAIYLTEDVLPVLGVAPARGRMFAAADMNPKAPRKVILSHGYCQQRLGGRDNVIGGTLRIDGNLHEVIGVMPASFRFLDERAAVYLPLRLAREEVFVGMFSYRAVARLKPGVSLAAATADVNRMLPLLTQKFRLPPGMSLAMLEGARLSGDVRPLISDVVGDIGGVLWVVMAAVGIVLLVACANVANLLLARAEGRQQEFAVRAALGAGWTRLARELLVESLALGLGGGLLGVGVAWAAVRWLRWLAPAELPRLEEIAIDVPVLAFVLGLSVLAGLFFGAFPVVRYAWPRVGTALRARASRESYRTRYVLAVAQVALALVLLVSCGLMIRTAMALRRVDPGFTRPEQVLTLRLSVPRAGVPEPERVARLFHDLGERTGAIPGVEAVGFGGSVPMDGDGSFDPLFTETHPLAEGKLPPMRRHKNSAPGYFRALGQRIVAGRDFTWTDTLEARPVALLSEGLAREYWGSAAAAIGKRVRETPKNPWREVIGVVADTRDDGAHRPTPKMVYWPILKNRFWDDAVNIDRSLVLVIRTPRAGEAGFLEEVRRSIWSLNPDLPIAGVRTLQEVQQRSLARTSFMMVLLMLAGGLALVLGVVGIYGVIAHAVARRTREIGIRLALGSPAGAVTGLFLRQGLWMAVTGVAAGLAAAWPLARLLETLLYGVTPLDPLTYALVAVGLVLVTLGAAWIPSARATSIDPARTLRAE